jgi:thiosulfate dehydrogenase
MRNFIIGFVVAVIVMVGAVYFYFATGAAPAAVSAQAMPFEKRLAAMALEKRIEKEAPKSAPFQPTPQIYLSAAHEYVEHCAMCHGLPGKPQPDMGANMYPSPPMLFEGTGVTDDPPGQTYWVIDNGIRMTGMPSFHQHMTDEEKWQMALFLHDANKLPADVQNFLKSQQMTAHGMGTGESHEHGEEADHDHDHDHGDQKKAAPQPHQH